MKRLSIVGLMLASAFALTNCSQEIVPPIQENDVIVDESIKEDTTPEEVVSIPFEVYANSAADEAETKTTNAGNNTKWAVGDDINVYHSVHNANDYVNNHAFVIADTEKGLFGGGLKSSLTEETYDWCFLYPYDESRGKTISATNKPVVGIGATKGENGIYVQKLTGGADSKSHIAGEMFPMYGQALNIPADKNPKVQMKHMSAIVALKIVNQGDSKKENLANEKNETDKSSITINDITFAVPEYNSSAIKQTKIPIVGSFKVDPTSTVNSNSFTPVDDASSNSVSLDFTSTTIKPGESATFYVAVRPFDVSNSTLGGSEERTGLTLSITVNGSTRSVEIPAETKFEAGKVTTLRVPVKLSHTKVSDAVNANYISVSSGTKKTLKVNGESIDQAYVLTKGKNITISGSTVDLINALPASFYVSYWKDSPAAMTVNNINVKINGTPIADYQPFINAIKEQLKDGDDDVVFVGGLTGKKYDLTDTGVSLVTSMLDGGIPREGTISLTEFIAPSTITFRNILDNGAAMPQSNSNVYPDILILDEEPIHKNVNSNNINSLFAEKFPGATYTGLRDILNNLDTDDAKTTKNILFETISNQLCKTANGKDRVVSASKSQWIVIGTVNVKVNVKFSAILNAFFTTSDEMCNFLRSLWVSVDITPYPYSTDPAAYGTKGNPVEPNKTYNPLIIWGLDAWGE